MEMQGNFKGNLVVLTAVSAVACFSPVKVLSAKPAAAQATPQTKAAATKASQNKAPDAKATAQSPGAIDKTFLTPADLGTGYKMTEQHFGSLGDQPKSFANFKGENSGIKAFEGPLDNPCQRVVDIRWVFPNEKLAQNFLDAAQAEISEGVAPTRGYKPVGASCKAYGGVNMKALQMKAGVYYHYYYIFREGRCIVKVYVSEGLISKGHPTPDLVYPLAVAAAKRCKGF
jgi:hypothetical protein